MKVTLMKYDKDAHEMLIFSKRTRHMTGIGDYDTISNLPANEVDSELDYVFNTIGSRWEFSDYVFLIEGVTRAFTHQLVRHRVGVAFAQQAQRVAKMEDFQFLTPPKFNEDQQDFYNDTMAYIQTGYNDLLHSGADAQDARGVLPTNICTNILMKINLRALSEMTHIRMCIRAQGEFQNVVKEMVKQVVSVHPYVEKIMGPLCVVKGVCAFPRYQQCPVKANNPHLNPAREIKENIKKDWQKVAGFDPQPDVKKSWETEDVR